MSRSSSGRRVVLASSLPPWSAVALAFSLSCGGTPADGMDVGFASIANLVEVTGCRPPEEGDSGYSFGDSGFYWGDSGNFWGDSGFEGPPPPSARRGRARFLDSGFEVDTGFGGSDGSDGTGGSDGTDGTGGSDGTDGTGGSDGTDGTGGSDGTDGTDGSDGTDGTTGGGSRDLDRGREPPSRPCRATERISEVQTGCSRGEAAAAGLALALIVLPQVGARRRREDAPC
jgi:hypothetical protein